MEVKINFGNDKEKMLRAWLLAPLCRLKIIANGHLQLYLAFKPVNY